MSNPGTAGGALLLRRLQTNTAIPPAPQIDPARATALQLAALLKGRSGK